MHQERRKHRMLSRMFSKVPRLNSSDRRYLCIGAIMLCIVSLFAGGGALLVNLHQSSPAHAAATVPLGLNIDFNEQSQVDMIQNAPRFQGIGSAAVTADANGWPTSDFAWVIDNRYTFGWVSGAVNIDPLKNSTDISGTYKLSFTGQAQLADASDDPAHAGTTITNQQYNAATNTTTADVNIPNPSGGVLMILQFTQTKRTASSAAGSGVTNVKAIRPGYTPGTSQVFTNVWLSSLTNHNWSAFRWMDALGTNDYADPNSSGQPNNESYPIRLNWSTNRRLPNAGPLYSTTHPGIHGVPWEYVVLIAQLTHKDQWINIPVNASDDYVNQLATLLKNGDAFTNNQGIPSGVNLYVEYSNEMWHYGFNQGPWNNQAALDEVAAGGSNLNYDNCNNNNDCYRFRRIAKRTLEIGNQLKTVFSDNGTRIRPVVNNVFTDHDSDMLTYVQNNYGTVSNNLYAISQTAYYSSADKSSVDAIIAGEQTASDNNRSSYQTSRTIANQFGLHSLIYEGGQDEEGNKTPISPVDTTLANQFAAARDARMQQVEYHDVVENWAAVGGELYMQFAHVGRFSTFGMWGLSDDVTNQSSGKWKGMDQIMGTTVSTPTPTPSPTPSGGSTSSYEAEASVNTLAGGASVVACPSCSGGQRVGYLGYGATLQFNQVSASAAGSATLTIYYTLGDAARSGTLSVNGGTGVSLSFPTTGSYDTVGSITQTVNLLAGNNTIKFSNASGYLPDFDRITVTTAGSSTPTPTPTPSPTPSGGSTSSYEAEASVNTLAGGASVVACPSCSGGQRVGYLGYGATLQFNQVSASAAGSATLTIYYTLGDAARSGTLSVNGGTGVSLNFPTTGSYDTVGSITQTVNLLAGNNTIKFSNASGYLPDFDRITVTTANSGNTVLTGSNINDGGGAWNGSSNTADKAFDNNTTTYYDAATATGAWTGLDLGSGHSGSVNTIKYYPRSSWAARMVGGKFQCSNDLNSWSDLATIASTPPDGQWTTLTVSSGSCRYLRYLSAGTNSFGNVAEIQFIGSFS